MGKSAFFDAGIPSRDILLGLGASLLVHVFIVAVALIYPRLTTPRDVVVPFYRVKLVTPGEIRRETPSKTRRSAVRSGPQVRHRSGSAALPVMSVRRLRYQPSKADVRLKKLENREIQPKLKAQVPVVDKKELEGLLPKTETPPEARETIAEPSPAEAPGTPPSNESDEEIGLAQRLYYTEVWNAIRSRWSLPPTLRSSRLEAVLVLTVRRDGRIVAVRFEKRSGNEAFDESALRAVRKANPLPPFPEIYSPKRIEIGVRFRPEDR